MTKQTISPTLPELFRQRMKQRLGGEYPAFEAAMGNKPLPSVRIHPVKGQGLFEDEEKIPWCEYGHFLKERPAYVHDPLYHAGAYYAQEASSMLLCQFVDRSRPLRVLDLCAAPGGKSSLLLSYLHPDSILVSNELVSKRTWILYENLVKWGDARVVVTQNRAEDFLPFQGFFDLVLLDAPCSGEGMFRKDPFSIQQWSDRLVESCAAVQNELLEVALQVLKPGGRLVYSTCTFEERENEDHLKAIYATQGNNSFTPVSLNPPPAWGLYEVQVETNGKTQPAYYCFPHRTKGEGFFAAALDVDQGYTAGMPSAPSLKTLSHKQKTEIGKFVREAPELSWPMFKEDVVAIPRHAEVEMAAFAAALRVKKLGCTLGQFNRDRFIPDHDAAMTMLVAEDMPDIALDFEQAIQYQQRRSLSLPEQSLHGWITLSYEGCKLGWAKAVQGRINNHYPKEWRIRKELDKG